MSLSHRAYCGRFAPSPTGPLHFGSLVCALASFLDARAHDGTWLIRIEDIDPPRDIPGADEAIIRTLTRLGMVSDIPVVWQSRRYELYEQALGKLSHQGLVYGARVRAKRSLPRRLGSVYPLMSIPVLAATEHTANRPDRSVFALSMKSSVLTIVVAVTFLRT